MIPMVGATVATTVDVTPLQSRLVWYGAFRPGEVELTSRRLHTFAQEHLSATCEDRHGATRTGELR